MSKEPLNSKTFLEFCWRHCDKKLVHDQEELVEDLQSIKYLKKLVTRYKLSGDMKERLLVNHLILLNNLFGPEVTTKILYYKMGRNFDVVVPFLRKMNMMPRLIFNVEEARVIDLSQVEPDQTAREIAEAI